MKIAVTAKDLKDALSKCRHVVEKVAVVPVFRAALLEATDNKLTVTANDFDIWIRIDCPCVTATPGECAIDFEMLHNIVKSLGKDDALEFSTDERHRVSVVCGKTKHDIAGYPPDSYPKRQTAGTELSTLTLPQPTFRALLDKTFFAAEKDGPSAYLQGVHITTQAGRPFKGLVFVATDRRMLAVSAYAPPDNKPSFPEITIPNKTVFVLRRLIGKSDKPVEISTNKHLLFVECEGIRVTSKLIADRFPPNWVTYFNMDRPPGEISLETKQALLKFQSTMSTMAENDPGLIIERVDNDLILRSYKVAQNQSECVLESDTDIQGLSVALNPRFFETIASNIKSETIDCDLGDGRMPILIKPTTSGNDSYLIMPMKGE